MIYLQLLAAMQEQETAWAAASFAGSYADARLQLDAFHAYKAGGKRVWVRERTDLAALLGNIQTKLRTYHLRPWAPAEGLAQADLDAAWARLAASEARRSRSINAEIRRAKEALRVEFARRANDFEAELRTSATTLASLTGELEEQKERVAKLQLVLAALEKRLEELQHLEKECVEANVEENDHTVFTRDDLKFELELVVTSVVKKLAFIDNQVRVRRTRHLSLPDTLCRSSRGNTRTSRPRSSRSSRARSATLTRTRRTRSPCPSSALRWRRSASSIPTRTSRRSICSSRRTLAPSTTCVACVVRCAALTCCCLAVGVPHLSGELCAVYAYLQS
jgi:hypothetical protein